MGRFRTRALTALIAVLSLTLSISPGFGQSGAGESEAHEDFLSSSGEAILAAQGEAPSGTVFGSAAPSSSGAGPTTLAYSGSNLEILVGANVRANAQQVGANLGIFGRSETTIAASEDGRNLVAGWNDAQGFCGPPFGVACTPQVPSGLSGFAFSSNGGTTWTDGGAPDPALGFASAGVPVFTRGDPWMAFGGRDKRTFFYANLAVHATTGDDLGVSVHRGQFSGSSFAWQDVRVFNAPNAPNDFYDKEAIAVDGRGRGIVTLTNFIELCGLAAFGFGQIEAWRTNDGGNTWLGPTIVNSDITFVTTGPVPPCGFSGVLQQSSAPAIGPNGELYVVWQRGPTFLPPLGATFTTDADIVVGRSLNGGVTFDPPVLVRTINTMRGNAPVGYNRSRINDHPRISVDQGGRFRGRIYVVFASAVAPVTPPGSVTCPPPPVLPASATCVGQSLTSSQVFVSFSDNRGITWSTPQSVAPAPPSLNVKRFWPVVDVMKDGNVAIVYYEVVETNVTPSSTDIECIVGLGGTLRRVGPRRSLANTKLVVGTPDRVGGIVFSPPIQVTTATSNWCPPPLGTALFGIRPNFGDYIGSATASKGVFPVWADSRTGPVDTFFAMVEVRGRAQVGSP